MERLEKSNRVKRSVELEYLGLCEHCDIPLSFEKTPDAAINLDWKCPSCDGLLTGQTFGYKKIEGEWQRVRWVGPEGKWVDERPTEDFTVGNCLVLTSPPLRLTTSY